MTCSNCCVGWCCLLDSQSVYLDTKPDAVITQAKLPDTILFNGSVLSLGTLGYGNTTNGVFYENNLWAVYTNGVRRTYNCLNSYPGIKDQFPDQLNVTYSAFGVTVSCDVSRVNVCEYYGTFIDIYGDERGAGVIFNNGGAWSPSPEIIGNVWFVIAPYIVTFQGDKFLQGTAAAHVDDLNGPLGTYTGIFAEDENGSVTVTATVTAVTP